MTQSVKIPHFPFRASLPGKIFPHRPKYKAIILIYNATILHRHHIIKAAPPVHTQRKGAILHFVSERKLHLVSVLVFDGTAFDALPNPGFLLPSQALIQKALHLPFLHFQLLPIGQGQIIASAAHAKMGTRLSCFLR
jgi:hypothetical protein